jgi:hypothetical protein
MITSPNRLVAIATPLIFAPLAGIISTWAAQKAPGTDLSSGQIEGVFVAGATIALAKGALWMKGWQDYEKRQEATPADALESPNDLAVDDGGELDLAEGETDFVDDEMDLEDPDDVLAQLEAGFADEDDAVPAQEV